MDDALRKLQLTELEILDEFVRICEENGLRYYLIGGTLLGAVRHHGFIPWDDDIDVCMPRADYDRLAEIWEREASPRFFYQSPDTDPNYFLTYAKIRLNGTEVFEERFEQSKFHKGIFMDIFPLDFCPAPGPVCHFLFNVLAVMNYRGQIDSGENYTPYRELSGKIGYAVLRIYSPERLWALRQRLLRLSRSLSRGKNLASYSGAYGYYKEVYPADWFGEGITTCFENKVYRAPVQYDLQLRQLYGEDYMIIPPPDKQKTHISRIPG